MRLAGHIFCVICALALPLGVAVLLGIRRRRLVKPMLLGGVCFLVFQVLTRMPLIQFALPQVPWFAVMSAVNPLAYVLLLGVTAALFEEGGRYIVMKWLMRDRRDALSGAAFGLGHGGMEAVLLVGINAFALLFVPSAASEGEFFASGLERLFAMTMHVGWSVLVMKSVREGRFLLLLWAFLGHAALDAVAVLALTVGLNMWIIEGSLGICALGMLAYIVKELKGERKQ